MEKEQNHLFLAIDTLSQNEYHWGVLLDEFNEEREFLIDQIKTTTDTNVLLKLTGSLESVDRALRILGLTKPQNNNI